MWDLIKDNIKLRQLSWLRFLKNEKITLIANEKNNMKVIIVSLIYPLGCQINPWNYQKLWYYLYIIYFVIKLLDCSKNTKNDKES